MSAFIAIALVCVALAFSAWWLIKPDRPPAQSQPATEPTLSTDPAIAAEPAPASNTVAAQVSSKTRQDVLRRRFQRFLARGAYGMEVTDSQTRELLAEFRVAEAIARTQTLAATGSTSALILLSEMSEMCAAHIGDGPKRTRARADENETEIRASAAKLPASLRANIETALDVDRQWMDAWLDACPDVEIDSGEIARQLRAKADTGDEVSLRRLADLSATNDEDRLKLLQSAALLGNEDAVVQLAATYHWHVTHDNNRSHLKEMKYWLEAAARVSPHGQYLLGDCRLKGCDGEPADIEGGLTLLREAAGRGDGFALKQLADVIAGGTGSFTSAEQYAWLIFEQELRDAGCAHPLNYAYGRIDNWKRIQAVGQSLSPYALSSAQALGERYWRDYAAQAESCD